jgi:hypothetical protein
LPAALFTDCLDIEMNVGMDNMPMFLDWLHNGFKAPWEAYFQDFAKLA